MFGKVISFIEKNRIVIICMLKDYLFVFFEKDGYLEFLIFVVKEMNFEFGIGE